MSLDNMIKIKSIAFDDSLKRLPTGLINCYCRAEKVCISLLMFFHFLQLQSGCLPVWCRPQPGPDTGSISSTHACRAEHIWLIQLTVSTKNAVISVIQQYDEVGTLIIRIFDKQTAR